MTAFSMAGDPWCPVHGQLLCRCTPYSVPWAVRPFERDGAIYETLGKQWKPPPPPLADNRKRRRARTALARRRMAT